MIACKFCKDCEKSLPLCDFHKKGVYFQTTCKICRSVSRRAAIKPPLTEEQKIKCRKATKEWRLRNLDQRRSYDKDYYYKNREAEIAASRAWNLSNPDRVKISTRRYTQKISGSAETRFKNAMNKRCRLQRVPNWLSEEQKQKIKDFYWLVADLRVTTGENYHVDHIIPLQAKNVCGLHVPWNLQILPSDLNLKKGNRWE